MPTGTVDRALADAFGGVARPVRGLRQMPAAAASIGQVHHGIWHDGRRSR